MTGHPAAELTGPVAAADRFFGRLGAADRAAVDRFNDTRYALDPAATAASMFQAAVHRYPDRIAVRYLDATLTYRECAALVAGTAAELSTLDIAHGDLVPVVAGRGPDAVIGVLACWWTGAGYVPLDRTHPPARLRDLIGRTGAKAAVCDAAGAAAVADTGLPVVVPTAAHPGATPSPRSEAVEPADVAYTIFTSGSTGAPRGVLGTHRGIVNLRAWLATTGVHGPGRVPARVALNAPLSFDASLQGLCAVLAGHELVVIPESVREQPHRLVEFLRTQRVEVFDCTPSHLRLLVDAGLLDQPFPQRLVIGGEPIDQALWDRLAAAPQTSWNVYGPTETTVNVSSGLIRPGRAHAGRPLPNTRLYVVDADGRAAPVGDAGELYVAGAGVGRGYLDAPAETLRRFVPDATGADTGPMYRTGDRARLRPDGCLEILGRLDDQLKVRGVRVEPAEVEAALLRHASVREAAVIGRTRNGTSELVGVVAPVPDAGLYDEDLRRFLAERLPAQFVPTELRMLDQLPRTASGKIDRIALHRAPGSRLPRRPDRRPRGATEEAVAAVWSAVLGLADIPAQTHFFDLGGDSLLLEDVAVRLEALFGRRFPPAALLTRPTVAGLAVLAAADPGTAEPDTATPLAVSGPSYRQQARLRRHADGDRRPRHLTAIQSIEGPLDADLLDRCLHQVIERHDILHTAFPGVDVPARVVPVAQPVLARLSVDRAVLESPPELYRFVAALLATEPGVLEAGLLVRAWLLTATGSADRSVLVLAAEHIACDLPSLGVLLDELGRLYRAGASGSPVQLPPATPFSAFVRWERAMTTAGDIARAADRLAAAVPDVPWRLEPREGTAHGEPGGELDRHLLPRIARSCGPGVTPFTVLLTAVALVAARRGSRPVPVLAYAVDARPVEAMRQTVGWFTNRVVITPYLPEPTAFPEAVGTIRQACRDAESLRHVPYDHLVERAGRVAAGDVISVLYSRHEDLRRQRLRLGEGLRCRPVTGPVAGPTGGPPSVYATETDTALVLRLGGPLAPDAAQGFLDEIGAELHAADGHGLEPR